MYKQNEEATSLEEDTDAYILAWKNLAELDQGSQPSPIDLLWLAPAPCNEVNPYVLLSFSEIAYQLFRLQQYEKRDPHPESSPYCHTNRHRTNQELLFLF